jgi:hypothetical protein
MRKYDKSLGTASKRGYVRSSADKLGWMMNLKNDTRKLQWYLNTHVGTITMLLTKLGLERMASQAQQSQCNQIKLIEQADNTHNLLETDEDQCLGSDNINHKL